MDVGVCDVKAVLDGENKSAPDSATAYNKALANDRDTMVMASPGSLWIDPTNAAVTTQPAPPSGESFNYDDPGMNYVAFTGGGRAGNVLHPFLQSAVSNVVFSLHEMRYHGRIDPAESLGTQSGLG